MSFSNIFMLQIFGRLVGAEQVATMRSRRTVEVEIGEPWGSETVERSMTSLKVHLTIMLHHYSFVECSAIFPKLTMPLDNGRSVPKIWFLRVVGRSLEEKLHLHFLCYLIIWSLYPVILYIYLDWPHQPSLACVTFIPVLPRPELRSGALAVCFWSVLGARGCPVQS